MVDVFRNFLYFSDSLVIDMEDDEGRECHQDIRGGWSEIQGIVDV